ncbi:MAG: hypothetical protein IT373_08450 [Polyangiaceae bacterium]|nr:hypothetical protein [Polyangiaceae bacterium]
MRRSDFLGESARAGVAATIRALEATTRAELVVAVRPRSAVYRETDYLVGLVFAQATLSALLFLPQTFHIASWPAEVLLGFVLGAFVSSSVWPLKRWLAPRGRLAREVRRAARAAFFDLGVGRTRERTGILVFVSVLERSVEVVLDVGAESVLEEVAWAEARGALERAVRAQDLAGFTAALGGLAAPLAAALPRRPDDANELPDELDLAKLFEGAP